MEYTSVSLNGRASNTVQDFGKVKVSWKMHNGVLYLVQVRIPGIGNKSDQVLNIEGEPGSPSTFDTFNYLRNTLKAVSNEVSAAQVEWDALSEAMTRGDIEFDLIPMEE